MVTHPKEDVASSLSKLSLKTTELDKPTTTSTNAQRGKPTKKKPSPVADSWEDEADDDAEDDQFDAGEDTPIASTHPHAGTAAPPPTPLSPVASNSSSNTGRLRAFPPSTLSSSSLSSSPSRPGFSIPPFDDNNNNSGDSSSTTTPTRPAATATAGEGPSRRPEKTDAVARRMIANALGMRAPRLTDEQKAYDRAVREKERKRREEEKEAERKREEEAARARQAIWDD